MPPIPYNPDDWLVTCHRALKDYVLAQFDTDFVTVEMNFPNTQELLPLPKTLIHFEQDDMEHPVLGFGTPGKAVYVPRVGPAPAAAGSWVLHEAQVHLVNFDIGVWASRESGGATHRMQVVQVLSNTFARPEGKKALREAGLWVVSFVGGRNELDRLNDTPVWRAVDMTLIVRVVSRHIPLVTEVVPDDFDQTPQLTTLNTAGGQSPVT